MGDPRKSRSKYKGPRHPWQAWRIEEEKGIKNEYGLKNKTEIWKAKSELRRLNAQAKRLIRETSKGISQAVKEERQLLDRLHKLGLLNEGATLSEVLALELKDYLNRRLQTVVFKSGMAMTMKQARQFIIHGHISISGKKVTVPSYILKRGEEFVLTYNANSSLHSEEHPERIKKNKAKAASDTLKASAELAKKEAEKGELTEEELEKIEKEIGTVDVEV